jgi:DNA-binding beta-propeller fold protein YncE
LNIGRPGAAAVLCALALLSAGCATAPKSVDLVWPLAPEQPRIRYVGYVSSLEDLGVSGWSRMKEFMFGDEPVEKLVKPYGVAVDSRGRLYVADTGIKLVFSFDFEAQSDVEKVRLVGMKKPGRLGRPVGLAIDANDNLYVSDAIAHKIVVYGPDHEVVSAIGKYAKLERPAGITIDNQRRRLIIADVGAHDIKVYGLDGEFLFSFGERGAGDSQFNFPTNVAVDELGRIYVVDSMNNRVMIFDSEGNFISKFGQVGRVAGSFARPKGIALDSEGHIYVVDSAFDNVQIFRDDGQLLLSFGEFGAEPGSFQLPAGIYIDGADRIYVSDQYNRRVQIFQYLKETPEELVPIAADESVGQ